MNAIILIMIVCWKRLSSLKYCLMLHSHGTGSGPDAQYTTVFIELGLFQESHRSLKCSGPQIQKRWKKDNIQKTQPIPQTFFNLNEVQGEHTFLTFFLCVAEASKQCFRIKTFWKSFMFSWLVGQSRDLLAWSLRDFIRKTALDRELMRSRLEASLFCTIWELMQISEGVIHRGLITPSEICRILHFVQRQNSIIYYSWKYFQVQNILTST